MTLCIVHSVRTFTWCHISFATLPVPTQAQRSARIILNDLQGVYQSKPCRKHCLITHWDQCAVNMGYILMLLISTQSILEPEFIVNCGFFQEGDITKMLAATVHIGSENSETTMMPYIFKRRNDGVNIINLKKTWEKMMLAARAIAAIENPQDIFVVSCRPYGQRAVLKFARYTGATAIAGRFTPGKFYRVCIVLLIVSPLPRFLCQPRSREVPESFKMISRSIWNTL